MELKFILESILFAADKPLSPRELRELLAAAAEQSEEPEPKAWKKIKEPELIEALEQLQREHAEAGRSFRLACVAGAWQFVSQPEFAPWLKVLLGIKNRPAKLSQPGLETLAIIAYRQPVTRAEMEQIRGVSVDGVVQTLLERGLIETVGRAEVPGRPMTYGTTSQFLEYFGLRGLEDLPAADELRRLPIKKPEDLLTVEHGLATAPPDDLNSPPAPAEGGEPQEGAAAPASGRAPAENEPPSSSP